MSLFPQGASSGMGGFSKNSLNEEKKEDLSVPAVPVSPVPPLFEEKPKVDPKASAKAEPVPIPPQKEEISPLQKTLLSQTPNESDASDDIMIRNNNDLSSSVTSKNIKDIVPSEKELDSDSGKKKSKISSASLVDKHFPTSVKISGITAPEDSHFDSYFHKSDASNSSKEDVNDVVYDNLSESERAEIEDMDKLYLEKFPSDSNPAGGICLDELLELAIDKEASDIHFAAENKIGLRINGHIHFIHNLPALSREQARALIFSLVPNPLHRRRIFEEKELDCAYEHKNGVNFRVNIFFKRGKIGAVLRKIASHAMTMEQLGLPEALKGLLGKKQGLLLVTGPTGSGKSTSMQTMLEYINENRVEHILTIEDPIEYIFSSKKSIFSQREVGGDTLSFPAALRASLREDPDVVMIGEMRDAETIQAAMSLSETGHLVISTLHTSSAPQTIARLVSNFPSSEQEQVQSRLADTLIGVLSQRLVSRSDRDGRVALFELMIVNSAIRNIIRTGDMTQIHNAMLAGREIGMVRMEDYAGQLATQGIVAEESFKNFFREE